MQLEQQISGFRAGLLLLNVTLLSACGGSETETAPSVSSEVSEESTTQSVLAGGEIIEQAQQQLEQFTADAENRLNDAMDDVGDIADDAEDEARQKAEELEDNVRSQIRNFGN